MNFKYPSLEKSKDYRDFGNGFYVTEIFVDALNILKYKEGYVYEYELDTSNLSIKDFTTDDSLIDYIFENRTNKIISYSYDLVIGKTACGYCSNLFKKIRNNNLEVNKEYLKKKILNGSFGEQICIKTEKGLEMLKLKKIHYYSSEDFI